MAGADPKTVKRHWYLAVWNVPQVGHVQTVSAFVSGKSRNITIPEINVGRLQRQLPEHAVLVGVNYIGRHTQYELTETSPTPVSSSTTQAYLLGFEQALLNTEPEKLVNMFDEGDTFNHQEWAAGHAAGAVARGRRANLDGALIPQR